MKILNPTINYNHIWFSFEQHFTSHILHILKAFLVPNTSVLELICTTYCLH